MSAGESAGYQAEFHRLLSLEHERHAAIARKMASNYSAAHASEKRLGEALKPLQDVGYFILPDRRWPGSRRAQVDFIVVGPGGVFIVDAKSWRDVTVVRDPRGNEMIYRDQADVTDEFAGFADLAVSTETALAQLGLAPGEVHAIAVFTNKRGLRMRAMGVDVMSEPDALTHITGHGRRLTDDQVERVLTAVIAEFPRYETESGPVTVIVKPPIVNVAAASVEPAVVEQPALISADEIHSALVQSKLAAPIEEWMAFLHPDQARLVKRSFNGPSRIRGAAGTGKTVVGLHRAAYLARSRPGKVLVTTFVRTLPAVLGSLMQRMAPEVADRVEFAGVFELAKNILVERGVRYTLDGTGALRAWNAAWREAGRDTQLAKIDAKSDYWREEVTVVIKGRGFTTLGQYENCARTGRRRGLTLDQRVLVWKLFEAYENQLARLGIWDYADLINNAGSSLREHPLTGYSAVVIDEAQDLSCAMIRMLHSIVGDRPDGLTLIGDGQQTIYPGGYTLSELGISIAGRGVIMDRNYRNTVEIAEFAATLVDGDQFDDIEGAHIGRDGAQILRRGPRPKVSRFSSAASHDLSLVARVRELVDSGECSFGDFGVLAMTKRQVADAQAALKSAGIATVNLEKYDGRAVNAVKVGTIKRAKGLEFKQVLVARAPLELLAPRTAADANSPKFERTELTRRELYVAMTRARDGLWVGVA